MKIELCKRTPYQVPRKVEGVFKVSIPKRLERFMLRFSLLTQYEASDIEYQYECFNTDDLIPALIQTREELRDAFRTGEPLVVLVGKDLFPEVVRKFDAPVSFRHPAYLKRNGLSTICGMQVHLVPWMEGLLVIPESWFTGRGL